MGSITKFSFDTSFDVEEPSKKRAVEEEAPPPEPTFSEADLASARQDGFAEGHEAGTAEMLRSVENTAAQALATISDQLGSLGPQVTETLQRSRRDAIDLARAITRKMFAGQTIEAVLPSIESVISQTLPRIMDEPRVVIRVSDDALDVLQERIPAVTQKCGFPGSLILLAEPSLSGADCTIEWADGGAEYRAETLWSEIDGLVERYLAGIGIEEDSSGEKAAFADAEPAGQTPSEEHPDG